MTRVARLHEHLLDKLGMVEREIDSHCSAEGSS